jgi:hypothetical protein
MPESKQAIYDALIGMTVEEKLWGRHGISIWMKMKIPSPNVAGEPKYYLVKNREKITADSNDIEYIIDRYLKEINDAEK